MAGMHARWNLFAEAFRHSITPSAMGLAFAGVLLTTVSWQLVGRVLLPEPEQTNVVEGPKERTPRDFHQVVSKLPSHRPLILQLLSGDDVPATGDLRIDAPADAPSQANAATSGSVLGSGLGSVLASDAETTLTESVANLPIIGPAYRLVEPFRQLFIPGPSKGILYFLFGGLLAVAIWAVFGGAIARQSVARLAIGKSITTRDALTFGVKRCPDIVSAVSLPLVAIAMMSVAGVGIGLLARLEFGLLISGLLWPVVIAIGMLMAVMSLGLFFGWPLMWGTLAAEDSDAFDAISRSFGYSFQRPIYYLGYALVAFALAALGATLAWCFAELVINFGFWSIEIGCGSQRLLEITSQSGVTGAGSAESAMSGVGTTGSRLIGFFVQVVRALGASYSYSFFWSVTSAIYLLLRFDTDQTDFDDVLISDPGGEAAGDTAAPSPTAQSPAEQDPSDEKSTDTNGPSSDT